MLSARICFILITANFASGIVINCGGYLKHNLCKSWVAETCAPPYRPWCDTGLNEHCCCPEYPVGATCVEPEPCHFICCMWPEKPCGYDCCKPNSSNILVNV